MSEWETRFSKDSVLQEMVNPESTNISGIASLNVGSILPDPELGQGRPGPDVALNSHMQI